jgi:hypothetical protein
MEDKSKNNVLIAKFMGYKNLRKSHEHPLYRIPEHAYEAYGDGQTELIDTFSPYFDDMKFHLSWDWLMPVVEKIQLILIEETDDEYCMELYKDITTGKPMTFVGIQYAGIEVKNASAIDANYEAVIKFIKWYNVN